MSEFPDRLSGYLEDIPEEYHDAVKKWSSMGRDPKLACAVVEYELSDTYQRRVAWKWDTTQVSIRENRDEVLDLVDGDPDVQ